MDVKRAAGKLAELTLMKFFPSEKAARAALVAQVCSFATTNEQVDWLVKRALVCYNEWPGIRELRALFCSRWKPADGMEAYSMIYPSTENGGGFPHSTQYGPQPQLTPGREEARALLQSILREQPPKQLPPISNPITQADIDRVQRERRQAPGPEVA
jgi:hypothetical protein